jgi:hypothetical protein
MPYDGGSLRAFLILYCIFNYFLLRLLETQAGVLVTSGCHIENLIRQVDRINLMLPVVGLPSIRQFAIRQVFQRCPDVLRYPWVVTVADSHSRYRTPEVGFEVFE